MGNLCYYSTVKSILKSDVRFEVKDIFGKNVRTTRSYWKKIFLVKHKELKILQEDVIKVLRAPDDVRRSLQDPYILLFYKQTQKNVLVVVVKYLNGNGFVVTMYKTSKSKRKGEKLWPK